MKFVQEKLNEQKKKGKRPDGHMRAGLRDSRIDIDGAKMRPTKRNSCGLKREI
jgi:hypothetical protein